MSTVGTLSSSAFISPIAADRRHAWPWFTSAMIFLALFLGVHDLRASQTWLTLEKGELSSLKSEESSGRASRQAGFLLLGAVGVSLLIRPARNNFARTFTVNPIVAFPLVMLLIWALFSAAWSPDVALSLKRQIVLVCMLLCAAGMIKQFTLSQVAEMMMLQTLLVVMLGVVVEAIVHPVLPVTNSEYRFAGTLHPNHMGINASLLLLSSLFVAHQRNNRWFLLISAIAVVALLMTKSRTALSSAVLSTLVFALLAYSPRKRILISFSILLIGGIATVIIATGMFSSLGQTVLMNRGTSDPTTLTGRTMIWSFALSHISNDWGRIFTGFGYGGFWTPQMSLALSQRARFPLSEGHNAYLDMLMQLGLPGLSLYLWCIFAALGVWVCMARRHSLPEAALAAGLICFALNHHLAESALTAASFPTLMLWFVIGSAAFSRLRFDSTGAG